MLISWGPPGGSAMVVERPRSAAHGRGGCEWVCAGGAAARAAYGAAAAAERYQGAARHAVVAQSMEGSQSAKKGDAELGAEEWARGQGLCDALRPPVL